MRRSVRPPAARRRTPFKSGSPAERFDPGTGRWSLTRPLTSSRNRPTATLLDDGSVLVAGGGVPRAERPQRLLVTAAALAGAPDFAIAHDGCTGTRVEPGATCRIAVAFSPTAVERGKRTVAAGRVLVWKGRGSLKLRGAPKLRGGDYALVLKLRGRKPVSLPIALR